MRHRISGFFTTVTLAVFLCAVPAQSQPPAATCATIDRVRSDVAAWKDNSSITAIPVAAMPQYMAALKADPGFAKLTGSSAAIVHSPTKSVVIVATFDAAGCSVQTWFVSRALFFRLIQDKGI
jgi:hypothetical protein